MAGKDEAAAEPNEGADEAKPEGADDTSSQVQLLRELDAARLSLLAELGENRPGTKSIKNEEVLSMKTTSSTREMLKSLKNELAKEREQKADLKDQLEKMKDILRNKFP